MSSRLATRQHPAASRKNAAAKPVASVRPTVRVEAAAKNETKPSVFNDPLWGMAIASAILFAILAALIASS